MAWTDMETYALKSFIELGLTFTECAKRLNKEFSTEYTRNACIGRAQRMGFSGNLRKPAAPREVQAQRIKQNRRVRHEREKAKRWAAKPWLAERADIREEREANSKRVQSTCKSKTSVAYRNHLPRLPPMTKSELRAMLAAAVVNTAQMEEA